MALVRPEIPTPLKVATPEAQVAVAVPTTVALRLTVIVTTVVESVVTVALAPSLSVTLGWVEKAEPLLPGATGTWLTNKLVA